MQKPAPIYSLDLVLHPEHDTIYRHFENADTNPFESAAGGLPRVNAWWLAEAALLTYSDPAHAIPVFQTAGLDAVFLSADSTDCYVASNRDFVIVAFRGTQPDEWRDVVADVNLVLTPWKSGRVHLGFKKALDVIRPQLDPLLAAVAKGKTVWFCGHSLGAALATLAADSYQAASGVCTIGSPRVGDRTFASAFNTKFAGRSVRFVNDNDVVTHVPLPFGYAHVDTKRFIGPDGTISNDDPAVPSFFADLIGEPRHLLEVIEALRTGTLHTPPTFLLDHMPKAYAIWIWNDYDANR